MTAVRKANGVMACFGILCVVVSMFALFGATVNASVLLPAVLVAGAVALVLKRKA